MITIEQIENNLIEKNNIDKIRKAYNYALKEHKGMKRLSGEDYITHPLEVAYILTNLNVDSDTIIAALLHETINNGNSTLNDIKKEFSEDIAKIVDSLSKINKLELQDDSELGAAYLRKILVGMAEDVRVLYIKLADRLHNMRTNWAVNPAKQKSKAKETMDILIPIAHRLGMNSIKSELENLCLQYLKPDVYNDILEKLDDSVAELNSDLESMKESITNILKENDINFEIKGRVKSVYSIYKKLTTGRKWSDIYDILALRIFVKSENECYTAVGLIHSKFRAIPKRFKDYVASPKENMYQSLHTSVFGDNGKIFEIQIRTYEMDEIAEKGIASHWSYKEKGSKRIQNMMEQKLEMFRNIIDSNNDSSDKEFEKVIETDFLNKSIYIYTPKGDVVELPAGATPIDFAYRIHSNVGDTTVGAIVNDIMVPFTHELKDGDIVKIMTNASSKPNKDWLNIVKTSQAKNKIKSYFSKKTKIIYINRGKEILEKELRKKKLSFDEIFKIENINKIIRDLKLLDEEDLYLAIGSLRYTAGYIINLVKNEEPTHDILLDKERRKNSYKTSNKGDIIVEGESNVLVNLAKCCHPVKGDEIVGYITRSHGITIHKKTCENINELDERVIDVNWNDNTNNDFETKIYITTSKEINILASLIEISSKNNASIVSFNSHNNFNSYSYEVTIKIKDKGSLNNLINNIEKLNNIKSVGKKVTDIL